VGAADYSDDRQKRHFDMNYWLFQANPNHFAVNRYLSEQADIRWLANQGRRRISVGDPVFIWQSGVDGGVIALAVVIEGPALHTPSDTERGYWTAADLSEAPRYQVRLKLRCEFDSRRRISRQSLMDDPICDTLPVFKFGSKTNYRLRIEQFERLAFLWDRGIIEIDDTDLATCMLAGADLRDGIVDETSIIKRTAVAIGREASTTAGLVREFVGLLSNSSAAMVSARPTVRAFWEKYGSVDKSVLQRAIGETLPDNSVVDSTLVFESLEGDRVLVSHMRIERNAWLVRQAKAVWKARDPALRCVVCGLSFRETYGSMGDGYIEAHHEFPLGETGPIRTSSAHLAPVCANCHRVLHRAFPATVETVRERLLAHRQTPLAN
jgi:predicted RNA-binding protein with PUA-like domain